MLIVTNICCKEGVIIQGEAAYEEISQESF